MKAITLTQPRATLVAIGAKEIETRSWSTQYRGEIAIHAATGLASIGGGKGLVQLCNTRYFQSRLYERGYVTHNHCDFDTEPTAKMPFGKIIAIAELYDIRPTIEIVDSISQEELAFGDYSPGRFAWLLRNVQELKRSVSTKGHLGLWNCDLTTI